MGLVNAAERINRAVHFAKLGAWTIAALVAPSLAVLNHNYLGVFLMGLISAAIGRFAFGPKDQLFRGSKLLGEILLTQGLLYAVYGGYVLFSPAEPWVAEAGGSRTSLVIEADGTVRGVEFREKGTRLLTLRPSEKEWKAFAFPGKFITEARLSEDGKTIIAPENRSDLVYLLRDESFEVETQKQRFANRSCDGLSSPPFAPALCAKTPSGARWLAKSGFSSGKLAFSLNGSKYENLSLPAPRPEALFPNPSNPDELWIAFWGSGVYRTTNRGKSWTLMGLRGSEVTSIVVDFAKKRAFASTGSGIFSLRFE